MSEFPSDWRECLLSEVVEKITSGGTPKADNPDLYGGGIPFLKIDDITSSSKYLINHKVTINERGLSESSAKIVPTGTLLLTMYGTIGRCCITTYPVATNQAIASFLGHPEVELEYLYYALESKADEFATASSQTTQANISAGILKQTPIAIPPLPEQKKIAEILSGIDKSIYSLECQRNKHLLTYQDLLDDHFRRSLEISSIPLGRTLSRSIEYGANASASPLESSGLRFLRITDIKEDGTLSEAGAVGVSLTQDERNKYQVSKGDVLLARTGNTVGKSYLYRESDGKLAFAGYLLRITPDKDICLPEYFFLYTQSSIYKKWVSDTCRTGAQPNINAKEYGAMPVPGEPINDQQLFAEAAMAFRDSISAVDQKIRKQSQLKQALANDLLSGRQRVSV